jgi:hypothetical protein
MKLERVLLILFVLVMSVMVGTLGFSSCSDSGNDNGDAEVDADADNGDSAGDVADKGVDEGPVDQGTPCVNGQCENGATCCKNWCANLKYDSLNCDQCGNACSQEEHFCSNGDCIAGLCAAQCEANERCCGAICCPEDYVCCKVILQDGAQPAACYYLHCPAGCPDCE